MKLSEDGRSVGAWLLPLFLVVVMHSVIVSSNRIRLYHVTFRYFGCCSEMTELMAVVP